MIDPNWPTRKAIIALLTGITYESIQVKTYYMEAPNNTNHTAYIIINPITGSGIGNMTNHATSVSFSVTIYTYNSVYNSGYAKDVITSEVLTRIYPTPSATLDLSADNLQNTLIELDGDREDDYQAYGDRKYFDRTLTFRFHIHQK